MAADQQDGGNRLRIGLLGGFRVERGGWEVPPSAWQKRGKTQALVKLLALSSHHRLHRDQILDVLWPDLPPEAADRALRKALHYARHALEPELSGGRASRYLLLQDGIVSLAPEGLTVDADLFRERAQEALQGNERAPIGAVLALYTGDLLAEDLYEDWAAGRRAELSDLHVRLLMRLAELLETEGQYIAAVQHLQEVLNVDPTREDVHRAVMRLYVRSGSVHAALRQYTTCAEILRRELDAEPGAETEALRRALTSGRSGDPEAAGWTRASLPRVIRREASNPFVGRERALELLVESLGRVTGGTGEAVLVGGEAGVGKTRLVAEAAREGYRRGGLVLWGSDYESEGTISYGAVVEALEEYLIGLTEGERTGIVREYPVLARLLPSLSQDEASPADGISGGDRLRLFTSVARLFRDLSAEAPLILVLDDLHVADSATLELFHHLSRAARYERWLLMGTYREEEVHPGSALYRLRAALTRAGAGHRIDLHRLARPETDKLTRELLQGGTVPASLQSDLHSLSAGNPLFLQELVQTMRERDQLELRGGAWQAHDTDRTLPGGVRELVEERVHRLGEGAERALTVAAVAGMQVAFDLLLHAAGLDIESLLDALDRALGARILEEAGPDYLFRHPLVRSALYDRIPERRRMVLHETVGRTVERMHPDAVEALAHHFVMSGNEDKAIHYLELSGDRAAATFANKAAIRFYRAAAARPAAKDEVGTLARIAQKLGAVLGTVGQYVEAEAVYLAGLQDRTDPVQRVALLRGLAHTLEKRGDFQRALETLDAAEAEARAAGEAIPALHLVDILANRGQTLLGQTRLDDAEMVVEQALSVLETAPDEVRLARVYHIQAQVAMRRGDSAQAFEMAKRGLAVAESAGDLRGISACLTVLTIAASHLGDTASADAYQRRGIEIAERRGDRHGVAIGWNNLGVSAHTRGEYDLARECYRTCIAIREEIDDKEGLAVSWINLSEAALFQGDLEEAEEDCGRSAEFYKETDDQFGISYVRATRAAILYLRGDLHGAENAWRESLEMRQQIGDGPGIVDSRLGLAEIALAAEDLRGAFETGRWARRMGQDRSPELEARGALLQARSRTAQGRIRHAEPLVAHARALAAEHGLGRIDVHVLLTEAERCLAAHCLSDARAMACEGLMQARRLRLRIEEGIALRLIGTSLTAAGQVENGLDTLSYSATLLRSIGAGLEEKRSEKALAACIADDELTTGP